MSTPVSSQTEAQHDDAHVDHVKLCHCNLAAMVLEVSAPKAGNVHKGASFDDVTWLDFVTSAIVSSPVLAQAGVMGVGKCVLGSVEATMQAVASNTNLGMLLLLGPLCAASGSEPGDVQAVLDGLDDEDARHVYQAIGLANPGGLGKVEKGDVSKMTLQDAVASVSATASVMGLVEAMGLAASRDTVARQYVNGFADVYAAADALADMLTNEKLSLDEAIVLVHLQLMAGVPDTLIARKLGQATAQEAAGRAQRVLDKKWPDGSSSGEAFDSLDRWLRADGHKRNPGTSADLVAAALWVVLRRGKLQLPQRWRENLWS